MLKVFLVEDESLIREGLRDNIPWEQYGYRFVGEAADGEMALPLIRKTQPDVLITDIKMPFMDGLSLSRIVSSELPKTKIIIISGYDDFEYARQAINIGVDQYLLKPITRLNLKNVLLEMKEKIAQEMEQQDYQAKYQMEMQEYEKFSRRHFFERLFDGELTVEEIYEEAGKLSIDLVGSAYNLLFFCMQEKDTAKSRTEIDSFMRKQEAVLNFFLKHPEYIVFGWNVGCYGVLIKAEPQDVKRLTVSGIENVERICKEAETEMEWYVAAGEPVERLSLLPSCYEQTNHYLAYRFMVPKQHILTGETLNEYLTVREDKSLDCVDPSKMNPEIIKDFLAKGNGSEIHDFVESYLQNTREALESRIFRNYVVLNIRFAAIGYVEELGASQEEYLGRLANKEWDMHMDAADVEPYFVDMLQAAMEIRDAKSDYQSGKVLRKALEYIDENFAQESLSLNRVAEEVNVSANYLSTIFSQSVQKTFIEYVTGKRMEKARKMLKNTDHSTGEIAQAVGYKDPHYFSFVFKKTQGCSPREYRNLK